MKKSISLSILAFLAVLAFAACSKNDQQQTAVAEENNTPTAVVNLDVQGMTCTGCEASIKMSLKKLDGVKSVEASYEAGEAKVTVNPEKVKEEEIIEALGKIGYTAKKKDAAKS